jgi:hypothetical protein
MKNHIKFGHISLNSAYNEESFSQSCRENHITHFVFLPSMRQVKKYFTAGQATDDNMAHGYYMLDT